MVFKKGYRSFRKGKTYEEIFGEKKAKEWKNNISKNHKGMLGKYHTKETKQKIGFANSGEKS
jgi:hypothetical protein